MFFSSVLFTRISCICICIVYKDTVSASVLFAIDTDYASVLFTSIKIPVSVSDVFQE